MTTEQPTSIENVEDDLARELAFYNQVPPSHTVRSCFCPLAVGPATCQPFFCILRARSNASCPCLAAQALSSAQVAIRRFQEKGVPWLRPVDYYAEMVKSDEHMAKVSAVRGVGVHPNGRSLQLARGSRRRSPWRRLGVQEVSHMPLASAQGNGWDGVLSAA